MPQNASLSPLEVTNFNGGVTDYFMGASMNRYKKADNLLIIKQGDEGKLYTRPGSAIYDATYYQIPAAQRIGAYKYFDSNLFYFSARKVYYVGAGWVTMAGPTSHDLFSSAIDTTNVVSIATWNHHLFVACDGYEKPQFIYKDGSAVWQLRTAGFPYLATSPTVTKSGGTGQSFLYRFLYRVTYTVGTRTYTTRGPATEVILADSGAPDVNNVAITAVPTLGNGSFDNYDTTNVVTEVYRTTNGGQNFFLMGTVANGTATKTDSMSDATLQQQLPLYTEGGAPDFESPPLCKAMHVVDDTGFYGNIKVGSEILANRIRQSIPGIISACPSTFFTDVQDDIVTISSVRSNVIALCNDFIYRLDGRYDQVGTGFTVPVKISDTAGCVSALSVVQTLEGIYWAGNDGFYFSDGFQVQRISDGRSKTYKDIIASATRKRRIVGKFDAEKKRIWWTVQAAASATEVDECWVLDLNFGFSSDMAFTTCSGGDTRDNFAPTALEFIGGQLVRGDRRGYTFLHSDTTYTDPKIDTGAVPSAWITSTIIYDYISAATNFGTSMVRKWVPYVDLTAHNETNLSLQIKSINDDGRLVGDLKPIRFRGNMTWGDADAVWGDPTLLWNFQGLIDESRRFPAGGLRCEYKQVEFTNAKVAIVSSDLLGLATVSNAAHTATLVGAASYDWPSASIDYYLAFETDSYSKEYLVTARSSDVLTFSDATGTAPSGNVKWVLRGKPKGEILNLLGYVIYYVIFGMTQGKFTKATSGEVQS